MGQTLIAYLPFILIFFVMYFFLIRPQNKKQNEHKEMLESLKKGDKILTRGGIYGKIVNFQGKNENKVTIDTGSGVKLNIARSYIAGIANSIENEKPEGK